MSREGIRRAGPPDWRNGVSFAIKRRTGRRGAIYRPIYLYFRCLKPSKRFHRNGRLLKAAGKVKRILLSIGAIGYYDIRYCPQCTGNNRVARKTNREYSLTKITFILVSAYLLLKLIASFFPETRLWGLNHAAFVEGMPFLFPI